MKLFFRPLLRLQWKLTLSYTLITVATLLVLMFAGIIAGSETVAANFSQLVIADLKTHASELVPYVSATPPDQAGMTRWLQQPANLTAQVVLWDVPRATYSLTLDGLTTVVDRQGVVIASQGAGAFPSGTLLEQRLPQQAKAVLRAALTGQMDAARLVTSFADGTAIAAYPLLGPYGRIEGALLVQTTGMDQPSLLRNALFSALVLVIPVTILAALIGTCFGFLTAHRFSYRFKQLSFTVDQWGQGNFSMLARDASGDELGQLARRLNRMAAQLQTLLHARQQLATLEERNRLARDLHDSVKQQVFAISMLVNSAKGLLRDDLERAQTCLEETDAYVQHVQQELTALVQALRPPKLEEKGLVAAVKELASQWSHQNGIATQVSAQGEPAEVMVEEALFRVLQEALANVARHSQATAVEIALTSEQGIVRLRVDDNGQGFDPVAVQGRGIGLLSMRERMHALGGTLLVESTSGKGTQITAYCFDLGPRETEKEFTRWSRSRS
ncbi:MAG TPA: sensor histidine kinase [Ktedonobacteraceae bacterium]|nr:sensor histidine kinase [Ktedonobacteraceae bacterium]